MEFEFIFSCIMGFSLILIIKQFLTYKKYDSKEVIDWNKMQLLFFQKVNIGCKPYKLLDIYTPMDLMLIESLFLSENLPYQYSFRNFMGIWPFVHIWNYNNCEYYILEKDYNDAIYVIKNYTKTKIFESYSGKDRIRNILEMTIGGWVAYDPVKFSGIRIYLKKQKIKKYIPEYFEKIKKRQ